MLGQAALILRRHALVLGKQENNREDDISAIASKAEDKADKGKKPGLRAHFEKTIK